VAAVSAASVGQKATTNIAALFSSSQLETAQRLYREFKEKNPTKQ